ncbi:hypothetical protein KQX54_006023 [Cotesia glomerata]|uniref:Nucleoprotein n=1 Tax=Cotesia glomerata TaxID=32391 RepID=A0AAV7I334_COTGL|nr:hypothetical protein KQX54_006023 [Cotesia glomerata]
MTTDDNARSQAVHLIGNDAGEDLLSVLTEFFDPANQERLMKKMENLHEIMQYQGFDPKTMAKILISKHLSFNAKKGEGDQTEIEYQVSKDVKKKWNMYGPFHDDLCFLIYTFLTGSTVKNILEHIITKYSIHKATGANKRKAGTSLDPKVVTLSRISAAFPTITVSIFNDSEIRYRVPPSTIFESELVDPIPRAFWSPMMASVFPKDLIPLKALYAMALATDNVLHEKIAERTPVMKLVHYLLASCKSTVVPERIKLAKCLEWKIVEKKGTTSVLVEPITILNNSVDADLLKKIRPGITSAQWVEVLGALQAKVTVAAHPMQREAITDSRREFKE